MRLGELKTIIPVPIKYSLGIIKILFYVMLGTLFFIMLLFLLELGMDIGILLHEIIL